MSLFKRNHQASGGDNSAFASIILNSLHEGIVMTDKNGVIEFINDAAVVMTECGNAKNAIGLDYGLVIRIESKEGRELSEPENPLIQAVRTNQALDSYQASLISTQSDKRIPIAVSVIPASSSSPSIIITLRDIAKELEEEGEQTEFISTASHEMRTPVATIDGYLSLALNPQTATIDERARGYLTAAQTASRHLGKLFQNLLDVTRLDDGKIKLHLEPVEMVGLVKEITDNYFVRAKEQKITFSYGSSEPVAFNSEHRMEQVVYGFVDVSFMREILDNLIENALKYTPEGGSVYVNVRGDGDKVLINVTDTGIGISAEDLTHIFQKFYRVDNSDTRTIGGNGLGLYLVKQRVEAMGGRVWAESAFGEGSTFYVSLPRLSNDEYEKRMIMVRNLETQRELEANQPQPAPMSQPMQAQATPMPNLTPQPQPAQAISPQNTHHTPMTPLLNAQPTPASPPQNTQPVLVAPSQGARPMPSAPPMSPLQSPGSPPAVPPSSQGDPSPFVNNNNNNLNGELK